jgi:hypothetical protein
MARDWLEKHEWWLVWLVRFLYPVALFCGLAVGNLLIGYFGIETKAHAAETYVNKIDQDKINMEYKRLLVEFGIRQKVNRASIVTLNQKHGIPTPDYPISDEK